MRNVRIYIMLAIIFNPVLKIYSQSVDSLHLDVQFQGNNANIKAQFYYLHAQAHVDSLYFLLSPTANIKSITAANLDKYQFTEKKGRPFPFLLLRFKQPVQQGARVKVDFEYTLDLVKMNFLKYDWIEMFVDQFWFPNATDADNKFKSTATITNLYPGYSLFSYQKFKKTSDISYEVWNDIPAPEIAFIAGKDMTAIVKKTKNISITYFAEKNKHDSVISSVHQKLVEIANFYNHGFAEEQPVHSFSIAFRKVPRKFLNSQTTRKYFVLTGPEFNTYGDLAHEMGHFWWSDASFIREPWLNESFANYSMLKVLEKYDSEQFDKSNIFFQKKGKLRGPVSQAGVFSPNGYDLYYSTGAYLLMSLEENIGEKKMNQLLQRRIKQYINTTKGFLIELENIAGVAEREEFERSLNR